MISKSRIQTASCLDLLRSISKRRRAKYIRRSISTRESLKIQIQQLGLNPLVFDVLHFARLLNLSRFYFALSLMACRNYRLLAVCPQLYDNCMINNRKRISMSLNSLLYLTLSIFRKAGSRLREVLNKRTPSQGGP